LNFITELNAQLDLPVWLAGLEKKMIIMEEKAGELTTLFLLSNTTTDLMVNFLMIAILPAIGEEFLFRGILQRLFVDWLRNSHLGIILAAFIFSFIHFQFYGFVPRFLLGLYFGYLMFWSASIWVPVVAHLINNGMAVIYYHFNDKAVGETALDTIGTSGNAKSMVVLSTVLAIVVIMLIYQHEKKRQESFAGVT
jgi:membrane protease YdiL (CAAX protease family)